MFGIKNITTEDTVGTEKSQHICSIASVLSVSSVV
jgi:hypothetical protein